MLTIVPRRTGAEQVMKVESHNNYMTKIYSEEQDKLGGYNRYCEAFYNSSVVKHNENVMNERREIEKAIQIQRKITCKD